MFRRLQAPLILIAGCVEAPCYPETRLSNFTSYQEPADGPSAADLDQVRRVEACLAPLRDKWLRDDEAAAAECDGRRGAALELRACLKVAVAPDWYTSPYSGEQIFPCSVGPQRCLEKGQVVDDEHPCQCRAQIQDMTTIWVTPNRRLLSAYVVTVMTGCLSPWTPTLAPCSNIKP